MEQIKCTCERNNTIAERDDCGNVHVQCRGCKEKTKIEPHNGTADDIKNQAINYNKE